MRRVSLDELRAILERTPAIVQLRHRLSLAFVPEAVQVYETAEERSQRGRPFLFQSFKDDVAMFVIVNQLPNSVALSLIPPTVGNAPESGDDGARSVAQIIAFANLPQRFQSCLVNDVLGFRVIGPAQMLP